MAVEKTVDKKTRKVGVRTPSKQLALLTIDESGKPVLVLVTRNAHEFISAMTSLQNAGKVAVYQELVQPAKTKKLDQAA